jgi:multidrug efflux pump subunit AcrA (membrane-fusion protein)
MKKWLKRLIIIIVVLGVLGGVGYTGYTRFKDKIETFTTKRGEEELDTSIPVAVHIAGDGNVDEALLLYGDIVPNAEVNIFSTVPGKVKDIAVKEGDPVEKGSVLGFIDRSEAGLTFALTPVESTIKGVVKEILVEDGAYITPQVPLFQIINMDYVEAVVHIPEKDIYKVKKGLIAEIKVVSFPDRIFSGKVDRLSPVVDPLSRSLEARIRINNRRHTLKPGMFGDVRVVVRSKSDVVVIPFSSILVREGKEIVFIVEGDLAVQVEPGFDIRDGNMISVESGVKPGDRVVVIGQHNLNNGDSVNVTEELE